MIDHTGASPVTYYIHTDQLGRPQKMTDASANLVWDAIFQPFGEVYAVSGSATNYLMFPGQFYDGETHLSQNWHRDYDPTIGRYIQSDPIGLAGGINTYGYVGGNPLIRLDPAGLFDPTPLSTAERLALAEEIGGAGPEDPIADITAGVTLGIGLIVAIASPNPNPSVTEPQVVNQPPCLDKDKCNEQQIAEESVCAENYGEIFGWNHWTYHGCMERAAIRGDLCRRGISDRPPPWSDADVDGWRDYRR